METKKTFLTSSLIIFTIAFTLIILMPNSVQAEPVGTVFTYQGRLIDANYAADGLYDFQFKLFDANSGGNKLGADVNKPEVDVIDGYFTVKLDFGNVFDGDERWLEIEVKTSALSDPNAYALLKPRQKITLAPYVMYAKNTGYAQTAGNADMLDGYHANAFAPNIHSHNSLNAADGSPTDALYVDSAGNVGIGTTNPTTKLDVNGIVKANAFVGDGSGLTNLPVAGIPSGVIVMWSGSIANIPSGWALCDGTKGTPDLRDRFIFGAGNLAAVRDNRTVGNRMSLTGSGSAVSMIVTGVGDRAQGGQQVAEVSTDYMPPYYALAFIMKL